MSDLTRAVQVSNAAQVSNASNNKTPSLANRFERPDTMNSYESNQSNHSNQSNRFYQKRQYGNNDNRTNQHNQYNQNNRPIINTSLPAKNMQQLSAGTMASLTDNRPATGRSFFMGEDDFPVFPSKSSYKQPHNAVKALQVSQVSQSEQSEQSEQKSKKPTFAELALEWTRKLQEEKEKEAAAAAAAVIVQEKEDKDKLLIERIRRISLGVKKQNTNAFDSKLDIGCHNSDHSDNDAYDSYDDQTCEDEEEEEEEEEEDIDALWNYRRNKNEMY